MPQNQNLWYLNRHATTVKSQEAIEFNAVRRFEEKKKLRALKIVLEKLAVLLKFLMRTTKTETKKTTTTELTESDRVKTVMKPTTSKRNGFFEPTQQIKSLPGLGTGNTELESTTSFIKQHKRECSSCSPSFKLKAPRLDSRIETDRPNVAKLTSLPKIPKIAAVSGDIRH